MGGRSGNHHTGMIIFAAVLIVSGCSPQSRTTGQLEAASDPAGSHPAGASGQIAFYSHRDGNIEIYAMNADGSDQRRLTTNEFNDYSPAWSPDGSQIVFISDRDDPEADSCTQSCYYQLYIINADGSDERKLVGTDFSTLHPDWHPQGAQMSFDSEVNLQGDIYVINADGSDLSLLIEDGFWADWSPDGSQLVFASRRDGSIELYLANADGSDQRRLTQNDRFEVFPDWSPDGRRIAFTVLEHRAIYILDVDGGHEQRLTQQGNAENPAWSPDGAWIAYQSSNDGDFEIYITNVDRALESGETPNAVQLTDNQAGDIWPAWGNGDAGP